MFKQWQYTDGSLCLVEPFCGDHIENRVVGVKSHGLFSRWYLL